MDQNKIRSIVNDNMQNDLHFGIQWMVYRHPRQVITIMLLIIFLAGVIYWEKSNAGKQKMRKMKNKIFTDRIWKVHNLNWLETEVERQKKSHLKTGEKLYITMFCLEDKAATLAYEHDIYANKFKTFVAKAQQQPWFIAYSMGGEPQEISVFAHGKDTGAFVLDLQNFIRGEAYSEAHGYNLWLPLHIGVAELSENDSFDATLEKAHFAALEANRLQRDIYAYDENLAATQDELQQMIAAQSQALDNNEFVPWYQSIVDINTKKPVGAEALVRWNHPEMGMLLPERFLPIFESDGFVIPLDYYMLDMACKLQKRRHYDGKQMLPISIRQSYRHLEEFDYLERMKDKAKAYDLAPGMIDLEFAAADFSDPDHPGRGERVKNILKGLKNLGYTVTLDYFSQTSALEALYSLPIDTVKLAPSLLEQNNADILAGVAALGRERDIRIVALGVENKFQAERAQNAKCQFVQGFLYTRPLPEKEWLSSLGNK